MKIIDNSVTMLALCITAIKARRLHVYAETSRTSGLTLRVSRGPGAKNIQQEGIIKNHIIPLPRIAPMPKLTEFALSFFRFHRPAAFTGCFLCKRKTSYGPAPPSHSCSTDLNADSFPTRLWSSCGSYQMSMDTWANSLFKLSVEKVCSFSHLATSNQPCAPSNLPEADIKS